MKYTISSLVTNIYIVLIVLYFLFNLSHIFLIRQKKSKKNKKGGLNLKKLSKSENDAVLGGYQEAFEYCQYNFKYEPWNCPKPQAIQDAKHPISFTNVYKEGK
jgi:wnt family.